MMEDLGATSTNLSTKSLRQVFFVGVASAVFYIWSSSIYHEQPNRLGFPFKSFDDFIEEIDDETLKLIHKDFEQAQGQEFWINSTQEVENESGIESLARRVYSFHCENRKNCGGEWWIQVRDNTEGGPRNNIQPLHWDKDEKRMMSGGLYKTPNFTSVTYLSDGGYPTFALSVQIDDNGALAPIKASGKSLTSAYFGLPKFGRHITFDASLLHGVLYLPQYVSRTANKKRYVLVMSFWLDGYKPEGAIPMTQEYRERFSRLDYAKYCNGKELKNTAHELYANELDTMYKSSGQLQLHEKRIAFQHTTTFKGYNPALKSKVGTYHAVGCFPTPKLLRELNLTSVELKFGHLCQMDISEQSYYEYPQGITHKGRGSLLR